MNDQWYNFSDKKVELIEDNNPDIIVTKDAYVLFYRQKKMENIDWDNIYQKKCSNLSSQHINSSTNTTDINVS